MKSVKKWLGILFLLFLSLNTGFSGIKITYIGFEEDAPFYYTLIADGGKMNLVFQSSNNENLMHLIFNENNLYLVDDNKKTYMDFGSMNQGLQDEKEDFENIDWSKIKKTGKKMKIASYKCKEYKFTDEDGKVYYLYIAKNKKLAKAFKSVSKGISKTGIGPILYQEGPQGGVLLGIKENNKMIFKADKIKLGRIPAKTFSLKGYKKFDMKKMLNQMQEQMKDFQKEMQAE